MADPQFREFQGRVLRIGRAHARGRGFEAPGVIGRSSYPRRRLRRIPFVAPLLVLLVFVVLLKGAIHYTLGAALYEKKIALLQAGDPVDRVGAFIMQADPASLWVSDKIARLRR
ncbi:MAG: hypothetical protein ACK4KW_13170 [Gemmobacter sp.]